MRNRSPKLCLYSRLSPLYSLAAGVTHLLTARNILGTTHERCSDARMLDLKRWPNTDCYQSEHLDARLSRECKNPKRPPQPSNSPVGAQLFALNPNPHDTQRVIELPLLPSMSSFRGMILE